MADHRANHARAINDLLERTTSTEDRTETENSVATAIDAAQEFVATGDTASKASKPRLLVDRCNPHTTVLALRDILANAGGLYDRGVPVRLFYDKSQHGVVAQEMTPDGIIFQAHSVCRPRRLRKERDGTLNEFDAALPRSTAAMYLDRRGEWNLSLFNGVASAPLLKDDGTIVCAEGYDSESGMWCENVPELSGLVSEQPTREEAGAALRLIREAFKTFCFADAETVATGQGSTEVDTSKPPGQDESSFLVALMTAVCRPSLHLSPGVVVRASPMSGAGAGKGLLARCICEIAFGRPPHAVTGGATAEELEKRIAAELIQGSPALFIDNLNNTAVKSDLLASAITERPARVRVLGKSQMLRLNASAFVVLTGNGLTVSEDLARRFIMVDLDPRTEDPESREFKSDILRDVGARRAELLAALLTIWRWGRQADEDIQEGRPLGSFSPWCRWVRNPLLDLGCRDPVERVGEAKERDGRRQQVAELFAIWWEIHKALPVKASELHDDVKKVADPQDRGRQYLASYLEKLAGTRMAGIVLTRQASAAKWAVATYQLSRTDDTGDHDGHRGHRGHGPHGPADAPDAPYADQDHKNGSTVTAASFDSSGATPIDVEEGRL